MPNNNGNNTPGGKTSVSTSNPPSSEVGFLDSGGGQTLLKMNIAKELEGHQQGDDAFKRSTLVVKSPTRSAGIFTTATDSALAKAILNQDQSRKTALMETNYHDEWQKEKIARINLEQVVLNLQQRIAELEKKLVVVDINGASTSTATAKSHSVTYSTDEDQLAKDTQWILKKAKKRAAKKRKATSSPEISPTANVGQRTAIKENKVSEVEKTEKIDRPPPINILGINEFSTLNALIKSVTEKECKIIALNNDQFKVNVPDSEVYRQMTAKLNNEEIQWYTYENKATRPIKVMARGLHPSCETSEIVDDLRKQGFHILEATNIIKKDKTKNDRGESEIIKRRLPLFMLTFDNSENVKKIHEIKTIMNLVVKIEQLRRTTAFIPQCIGSVRDSITHKDIVRKNQGA